VEIVDPVTVRFHLTEPWPDFMTFYGTTATAAGIVVPKKYVTQVGDEGFRKHPIGAGPYRFVSHKPGVEVVVEAYSGYWRRVPTVKRYIMKSVPEGTTRVAMLKNGEAVPSKHASIYWIEFADQWDPKSPWHDKRVRLAVNYALNRQAINEVSCLGFCPPAGVIVPRVMEFALQASPLPHDPQKARQLLAEAGYPNGIDAGDFVPTPPFVTTAEAATNYLGAVGIRTRMRLMERAAFLAAWREKKLHGLFMAAVGNSGNAASRIEAFMYSKGTNAYGGYPDLDDLFHQQARERDPGRREALLHRIQQMSIDRVMYAPIMDYRTLRGVGPRIAEHMLDSMHLIPFPAYEEVRLKGQ
jgi:peptide/nickel transport system substrate-binding protein